MKNRRAITLLLAANFTSGLAQGMSMIAVPLYFAKTLQSNWFAAAYTVVTIVTLFWAPYAGTLVDKYNRKRIFVSLMSFMSLSLATIAATGYLSGLNNWLIFAAFGLTFWNYSLHYLCFYAFMQEITERQHYSKIASVLEVQGQLASALAGAGAAVLLDPKISTQLGITTWQLQDVFALDASTYALGLLIIGFMKFESLAVRKKEAGSTLKRLSTGLKYLKGEPFIFLFGVVTQAVFITVLLHVFELSPTYVKNHIQPVDGMESGIFATSEVFYSIGAVVAGLVIQRIFRKTTFLVAIIALTFITILEYSSIIISKSVIVFYVMSFMLGVTNAGIRVIRVSYLFKVVPNQVIGRANSIFGVSNTLFRIIFLALFALPFFHEDNHVIYTFMVLIGFLAIAILVLMLYYKQMVLSEGKEED